MHQTRVASLLAVTAALWACGGSDMSSSTTSSNPAPTGNASGFYITISRMAFTPLDLKVPPGATVTVVNNDSMPHSVTSEATMNTFVPGAVAGVQFDTGIFSGGQMTFTIPANAAEKTVIPYYCRTHAGGMATPNGTVTIDSSAQAALAGTTTGGGQPTGMPTY